MYTFAGTAMIGDTLVEFFREGQWSAWQWIHIHLSSSRPRGEKLCSIDADNGTIYIASKTYTWTLVSGTWMHPPNQCRWHYRQAHYSNDWLGSWVQFDHSSPACRCSLVRGYIRAEHYGLLADAVAQVELLIGIDMSEDRKSIDFRLRDMTDMCVEKDDVECVDVAVSKKPSEDVCDPNGMGVQCRDRWRCFGAYFALWRREHPPVKLTTCATLICLAPELNPWWSLGTTTAQPALPGSLPRSINQKLFLRLRLSTALGLCSGHLYPYGLSCIPNGPEVRTVDPDIVFPGMSISNTKFHIDTPSDVFTGDIPANHFPQVTFPQVTFPQVTFQTVTFPPVNVNLQAEFSIRFP
jgi:hypothetical protein